MRILFFFLAVFAISISSCKSNKQNAASELEDAMRELSRFSNESILNEKIVSGSFSIGIPDGLTTTNDLSEDASLQYSNVYGEQYVIVIEEDKQDFVDMLNDQGIDSKEDTLANLVLEIQLDYLYEDLDIIEESDVVEKVINEMRSCMIAIDANVTDIDVPVSYWIGTYSGVKKIFTVMIWTARNDKNNFEKEANSILNSLKESY